MSARSWLRARSSWGATYATAFHARVQHSHLARIRDAQDCSKDAVPVVALRSVTVPARDPAVAEMERGPRIREAVDGVGHRHALRAEDDDQKRAHRIRYLTGGRAERQRGQVSRARQNSQRPGRRRQRRSPERGTRLYSSHQGSSPGGHQESRREEAMGRGGGGRGELGSDTRRAGWRRRSGGVHRVNQNTNS